MKEGDISNLRESHFFTLFVKFMKENMELIALCLHYVFTITQFIIMYYYVAAGRPGLALKLFFFNKKKRNVSRAF